MSLPFTPAAAFSQDWALVHAGFFGRDDTQPGSFDAAHASAHALATRDKANQFLASPSVPLAMPVQCHSARCLVVPDTLSQTAAVQMARQQADGLATARRDVCLGLVTADCVPVLFFEPHHALIAVAHAGWRGAFTGILEATLAALTGLGGSVAHVRVALGPHIQKEAYEVQDSFRENLTWLDPASAAFFHRAADRLFFHLAGYIQQRLTQSGVQAEHITCSRACTWTQTTHYFSYRRACQTHEDPTRRNLSLIRLRPQPGTD